jgi:FeS assembly SUF system protein
MPEQPISSEEKASLGSTVSNVESEKPEEENKSAADSELSAAEAPGESGSAQGDAATPAAQTQSVEPAGPVNVEQVEQEIIQVLKTVYDPEIPVNIYELGLIYNVAIAESGDVDVKMTLTSPACPVAGSLPPEVQYKIQEIPGTREVRVDLVWDPPWNMSMMTEAARLQLGLF